MKDTLMQCTPINLSGTYVTLEPLTQAHLPEIQSAAADGELWKLFFTSVPTPENTQLWIDIALDMHRQQTAIPFAIREKASGKIVGSTRYWKMEPHNRRLEIGHTWYSRSAQRTGVNTECKLLLLTHAFEVLNCIAVEFRTDYFNHKSQAAIERLGAKRDGLLRNHTIMADGRIRDTVVYSILEHEWPGVKKNLQYMQSKYKN